MSGSESADPVGAQDPQTDQAAFRENDVVGGAVHPDAVAADAESDVPADATPSNAAEPPPESSTGTQDGPLLAQHETTTTEQIDGILAQTRADLGDESAARYAEVLRQRFTDSGMAITDEQIADLAKQGSGEGA